MAPLHGPMMTLLFTIMENQLWFLTVKVTVLPSRTIRTSDVGKTHTQWLAAQTEFFGRKEDFLSVSVNKQGLIKFVAEELAKGCRGC